MQACFKLTSEYFTWEYRSILIQNLFKDDFKLFKSNTTIIHLQNHL